MAEFSCLLCENEMRKVDVEYMCGVYLVLRPYRANIVRDVSAWMGIRSRKKGFRVYCVGIE